MKKTAYGPQTGHTLIDPGDLPYQNAIVVILMEYKTASRLPRQRFGTILSTTAPLHNLKNLVKSRRVEVNSSVASLQEVVW